MISSVTNSLWSTDTASATDLTDRLLSLYDKDGNSQFSSAEFESALQGSGIASSDFNSYFKAADSSGDGILQRAEFSNVVDNVRSAGTAGSTSSLSQIANDIFERADTDNDGLIKAKDLRKEFNANAPDGADDVNFQKLVSKLDTNGDGYLNKAEFMRGFSANGAATDAYGLDNLHTTGSSASLQRVSSAGSQTQSIQALRATGVTGTSSASHATANNRLSNNQDDAALRQVITQSNIEQHIKDTPPTDDTDTDTDGTVV